MLRNKKVAGRVAAIGTTAALAFAGTLVATTPANAATIADVNLVDCIKVALTDQGVVFNDATLPNVLDQLTGTLDCSGQDIHTLVGIGALDGIISLNLSNNPLEDLGDLEDLTQLLDLDLSDTGLDLTDLGDLDDIFDALNDLLSLDLSDNDLTELVGLDQLTELLNLDLANNGITDLLDLDGLEDLTDLLGLDLSDNLLDSLDGLPALENILDLDLSGNLLDNVEDLLDSLGDILGIGVLDLSDLPLTDSLDLDALDDVLNSLSQGQIDDIVEEVTDLLQGILDPDDGLIGSLLDSLGLDLGQLDLGGLIGDLLESLDLSDTLNLQAILDGLGLGGITLNPGDTTVIVNVPPTPTPPTPETPVTPVTPTNPDAAAITVAGTPTILGTTTWAQVLTANPGSWDASTLGYQWFRGATPIAGATGTQYKLVAADIGQAMTVKVTGSKAGATSVTNSSAPTAKVKAAKLKKTTQPKITGTVKVGKTVKAKTTGYNKAVKIKYQWFAGGKKIAKATKSTYKIAKKYSGKKLLVKITVSKTGYTSVVRASTSKKVAK